MEEIHKKFLSIMQREHHDWFSVFDTLCHLVDERDSKILQERLEDLYYEVAYKYQAIGSFVEKLEERQNETLQ